MSKVKTFPYVKNRLYEKRLTFRFHKWIIRMWIPCREFTVERDKRLDLISNNLHARTVRTKSTITAIEIVSIIEDCIPEVAAIELTDADGQGGLVYPDWNNEHEFLNIRRDR